jgi:glycosyltransferase involved in cell wall biosynthesis
MAQQGHMPLISLVAPFYNEGDAIDRFFAGVIPVLEAIDDIRFEIVCVNDGSEDDTLDRLVAFSVRDPRVRVIDLTRNFGKEAALTAGLDEANGDAVIPIDADLQDPPSLIPVMIGHWRSGAEVVVARRCNRDCDSFAKRTAATLYYRVHNLLFEVKPEESAGAYRLVGRWAYAGLTIAAVAFLYGGFAVGRTVMYGNLAPGYALVISIMLFIGGIELIGIGVVGECIGRIDDESKERAIYLVRRRYQARG